MITNFEEITEELTKDERALIPAICEGLKLRSEKNPIKAPDIVKGMNTFLEKSGSKIKMTDVKLRKCVNYIRAKSMLPVIATSKGYYVSYDNEVLKDQIKSLNQRANSIKNCSDGLASFLKY
jgi:hypothetical protein